MRPSRIIVGEVRQAESLDLLIALNSGLPGMCTIHANSAREAVTKMCTLPLLAGENVGEPVRGADRRGVDRPRRARRARARRRAPGARDRRRARPGRGRRRRDRRPVRPAEAASSSAPTASRRTATASSGPGTTWPPSWLREGEVAGIAAGRCSSVPGLFCIWWSFWAQRRRRRPSVAAGPARRGCPTSSSRPGSTADARAASWLPASAPGAWSFLVVRRDDPGAAGRRAASRLMAGYAPLALVRMRARQRRAVMRDLWPDAVDNIASAVRAGLSLPEALSQLGPRGPEQLRPAFAAFAEDYRATGRFQRVPRPAQGPAQRPGRRPPRRVPAHRPRGRRQRPRPAAAHPVGLPARGRPHPGRARDPAGLDRQRGPARGGRAVARAGAAVRPARSPCRPTAGPPASLVLAVGAVLSLVAYRVMVRIGRLPEDERVLR